MPVSARDLQLQLERAPLRRARREIAEVIQPAFADRDHFRHAPAARAFRASHSAVYSVAWCGCTPAVANSTPGCARASSAALGECSRLAPVTIMLRHAGVACALQHGVAVVVEAVVGEVGADVDEHGPQFTGPAP